MSSSAEPVPWGGASAEPKSRCTARLDAPCTASAGAGRVDGVAARGRGHAGGVDGRKAGGGGRTMLEGGVEGGLAGAKLPSEVRKSLA